MAVMIKIEHKKDCCGCEACRQSCPRQCISMRRDTEGFLYPEVDAERCVECGKCEKVCPVIHSGDRRRPVAAVAAQNGDAEELKASSSGGIFSLLAKKVISEGGVVFGACFDEQFNVVHRHAESEEDIAAFRGSKYVQSRIGDEFIEARRMLRDGRRVLFSGTPCQIAGLRRFLGKEHDNLLTVDVACHGVPSPRVWSDYLSEISSGRGLSGINFRNKSNGWKKFCVSMDFEDGKTPYCEFFEKNVYMLGFLRNIYLRPSCHSCPSKSGKSGSDITLADFWGVERVDRQLDDDRGVSLVLINTPKGVEAIAGIPADTTAVDYEVAVAGNSAIEKSVEMPSVRRSFWLDYEDKGFAAVGVALGRLRVPLYRRVAGRIKRMFGL